MESPLNGQIYRFLSFESFVDLILRNELAFVTYDLWDDPYEGFVLKAIRTNNGRSEILTWLNGKNRSSIDPKIRLELLEEYSKSIHLQSWTLRPESDALWRIYAHNGFAIRISSSIKKLNLVPKVQGFPVEYFPLIPMERELECIFGPDVIRFEKLFTSKRDAFTHEEEFRIISDIDDILVSNTRVLEILKGATPSTGTNTHEKKAPSSNSVSQPSNINKVKYIPFSNVPDFIESVMTHPSAPDWFVETVNRYCQLNNLNFLGKSKLYKFEY